MRRANSVKIKEYDLKSSREITIVVLNGSELLLSFTIIQLHSKRNWRGGFQFSLDKLHVVCIRNIHFFAREYPVEKENSETQKKYYGQMKPLIYILTALKLYSGLGKYSGTPRLQPNLVSYQTETWAFSFITFL